MKLGFNRDGDRVYERRYVYWPTDLLEAIDILLVFYGRHKVLKRVPTGARLVLQGNKAFMRRPLHKRATRNASRVMFIRTRMASPDEFLTALPSYIDTRLTELGIDPDSVRVCDNKRFAILWHMLTSQNNNGTSTWPKFGMEEFRKLVRQGFHPPKSVGPVYFSHRWTVKKKEIKNIKADNRHAIILYNNQDPPIGSIGDAIIRMRA